MPKKTPLQQVTEQHGGKEKLVDKLMGMLEKRSDESKDEFRRRLLAAPNSKLLKHFSVMTSMNDRFGGKDKLVDGILGLMNRARDNDYREKLLTFSPAKLLDLHRTWEKKKSKAA